MFPKVLGVILLICIVPSFNPSYFSATAFIKCEDSTFRPTCTGGINVLNFISATYGRDNSKDCPHPTGKSKYVSNTQCGMKDNVLKILKDECDTERRCPFNVTNEFFGFDPCPSIYKYLDAVFECVRPTEMGI